MGRPRKHPLPTPQAEAEPVLAPEPPIEAGEDDMFHLTQVDLGTSEGKVARRLTLFDGQTEIANTTLELPADDNDIGDAIEKLLEQAEEHGAVLRGSRKQGLFRAIANGTSA